MSRSINFLTIDINIRDFVEYLNKNNLLKIDKYELLKNLLEDSEFQKINSNIPKRKNWGSLSSSSSFSDLNNLDSPSKENQLSKIDFYFDDEKYDEYEENDGKLMEIDKNHTTNVTSKKSDYNLPKENVELNNESSTSSRNNENVEPLSEGRNSSDDVLIQNAINRVYKNPNSRPEQNEGRVYSEFEIRTIYTSLKRSYPNKRSWRSIMCSSEKCSHGYSCKYSHFRSFCKEGHINSCNNRNCETCGITMPQMCKYWINGKCKYENGAESNEANKCHFIHGWTCFECKYKNYNFLHVCNNTINGIKCSGLRIGINGY